MTHAFSASITIGPDDHRCRYWAKRITPSTALKPPSEVQRAADIPGAYLKEGDEELEVGEFLIQGEQVHHRKMRGWTYSIVFLGSDGEVHTIRPTAEHKAALKAAGMPVVLLKGSGELAASVRLIHGFRAAMDAGVESVVLHDEHVSIADFLMALALKSAWFHPESAEDQPTPSETYRQALLMKAADPMDVVALPVESLSVG